MGEYKSVRLSDERRRTTTTTTTNGVVVVVMADATALLKFQKKQLHGQIEARRKEVSDVERELEREKKKSARFEKTCVLISKEWNEIQSAFETVLEKHEVNA